MTPQHGRATTYLVDANVLSEPTRPAPDAGVIEWLRRHERVLAVDPIIIGEVRFGIELLPAGRRRRRLEDWFERGIVRINCLPWEAATGLRWATLLVALRKRGQSLAIKDSLIAATALVHDCVLVTRNTRDFQKTGARVLDPFAAH